MEFHEKLLELRKQKGLTQDQLAAALFVSRTAISKWESGRGYPSIDSLKAISVYFQVTIDELLSSEEILTAAEEDRKQKKTSFCDLVFGILDMGTILSLFLPLYSQKTGGILLTGSLLSLREMTSYLQLAYYGSVISTVLLGILTLTLQNCQHAFWVRYKHILSVALSGLSLLLYIISLQPYAASFLFVFLAIKVFLLIKKP